MLNYYNGIDEFPLYNWNKCQIGELSFVRKDIKEGTEKDDAKAWEVLYDDYLKEFGFGKESEQLFELQMEITELRLDFVIGDDNYILNHIDIIQHEIDNLLKKWEKGGSITTAIVHVSKWLGSIIIEKETTVKIFYTMMQEYRKEMEALKKQNNG